VGLKYTDLTVSPDYELLEEIIVRNNRNVSSFDFDFEV